jgi:hypothetical protein
LHFAGILRHTPTGGIVGICAGAVLLGAGTWWSIVLWKRTRISPEEAERRRRLALHATGKMGDATLLEVRENLVFYSYDVRGVEYTASQDVSTLRELLPDDPTVVNGVVYVKYDSRNPANSMILSEDWSGLRRGGFVTPIRRRR